LSGDMLARFRTHVGTYGPRDNAAVTAMLADIEAGHGVARGPRLARQARLGARA